MTKKRRLQKFEESKCLNITKLIRGTNQRIDQMVDICLLENIPLVFFLENDATTIASHEIKST